MNGMGLKKSPARKTTSHSHPLPLEYAFSVGLPLSLKENSKLLWDYTKLSKNQQKFPHTTQINQSIDHSDGQSINQATNQSINQSIWWSINKPSNQSINQSINRWLHDDIYLSSRSSGKLPFRSSFSSFSAFPLCSGLSSLSDLRPRKNSRTICKCLTPDSGSHVLSFLQQERTLKPNFPIMPWVEIRDVDKIVWEKDTWRTRSNRPIWCGRSDSILFPWRLALPQRRRLVPLRSIPSRSYSRRGKNRVKFIRRKGPESFHIEFQSVSLQ